MKKSKRSYIIVALLIILLALAIGYAAFSETLIIDGSATGTTTWEVKFSDATMSDDKHGTATFTDDTLTVNATLSYPGDGCTVTGKITNNGTLPAKLTKFTLTDEDGNEFSNPDITVEIPTIATDGTEVIAAGATCPVTISIKWNADSTKTSVNADFDVNFEYTQKTDEVNVSPAHGTH